MFKWEKVGPLKFYTFILKPHTHTHRSFHQFNSLFKNSVVINIMLFIPFDICWIISLK